MNDDRKNEQALLMDAIDDFAAAHPYTLKSGEERPLSRSAACRKLIGSPMLAYRLERGGTTDIETIRRLFQAYKTKWGASRPPRFDSNPILTKEIA